ncbi:MAG: 3-dehydroquinate synthase [Clostridia bacterium]|nr:3-dehydroquinate synthase [Clostridia bacterium]
MKTVVVSASKNYDIIIGKDVINCLPEKIKNNYSEAKVMVVTDDKVASLHLEKLRKILDENCIRNDAFIFPNGEKSKSPETLFSLLEALAEKHFTKSDVLLAFGGGVTGDLTGLAASLFLRGISVIQIPTTLLSMVDSSVGGKTAVNLKAGKNLAGVFNQPDLVICDTEFLKTLEKETFADGMAEIIKYGVLADENLFEKVKNGNVKNDIEDIIARCVEIKRDIVNEDEFDTGKRQLLNFGHTLGHAIEAESNFKISHGTAVAMGMVLASEISFENKLTSVNLTEEIKEACENNNLSTACPFDRKTLGKFSSSDKKISGKNISFIVPEKMGKCVRVKLTLEEFSGMLGTD